MTLVTVLLPAHLPAPGIRPLPNTCRETGSPRIVLSISSVDLPVDRILGCSLQLHTGQGSCPPPVLFFQAVLQSQFMNPASHSLYKVFAFREFNGLTWKSNQCSWELKLTLPSFLPSGEIKNILQSGFLEPMMLFPVCPSKTHWLLLLPRPPQAREGALVGGGVGGEGGVFSWWGLCHSTNPTSRVSGRFLFGHFLM